jgi:hypothetical protein
MNQAVLLAQEAGLVSVITEEEAANTEFDAVIGGSEVLNNPEERSAAADQILQSWRDKLPKLLVPGVSLCQSCENISLED